MAWENNQDKNTSVDLAPSEKNKSSHEFLKILTMKEIPDNNNFNENETEEELLKRIESLNTQQEYFKNYPFKEEIENSESKEEKGFLKKLEYQLNHSDNGPFKEIFLKFESEINRIQTAAYEGMDKISYTAKSEIQKLKHIIQEQDKVIQQNTTAMETVNEYLKMAHNENKEMKLALQTIANQTDEQILFTTIGSARQIAIGALKEDQ